MQIVVLYMNEIEKIKHEVQMNEWSRQVMSWKESGLSTTAWCKRENIPCSTFFYRERKVREFLVNDIRKDECCFEQLPVLPIPQTRDVKQAITISVNGLDINISNGTNEETIAAVLRAVKSAW